MIQFKTKFKTDLKYDAKKLKALCGKFGVRLVILHGSWAAGRQGKESDVDIGVLVSKGKGKDSRFKLSSALCDVFGEKCDLVILNGAESMIVFLTVINGVVLFEAKAGIFDAFKTTAISRYQDAAKFRQLEKRYLQLAIERNLRNG